MAARLRHGRGCGGINLPSTWLAIVKRRHQLVCLMIVSHMVSGLTGAMDEDAVGAVRTLQISSTVTLNDASDVARVELAAH